MTKKSGAMSYTENKLTTSMDRDARDPGKRNVLDHVWKNMNQQLSTSQNNSTRPKASPTGSAPLLQCHEHEVIIDTPNIWQQYRQFVRNRHGTLQLWDEAVTRLLFWAPHSTGGSDSRWREVIYGLLSLHRTAMDMAFQEKMPQNAYGTTLKVEGTDSVHAAAIRVALTVIHGLMPAMLEMSRSGHHGSKSESTIRFYIERIKFLLRISLLVSYWRKLFSIGKSKQVDGNAVVLTGVLRSGGMYYPEGDTCIPSVQEEYAQWRRRHYIGRRTGRQLGRPVSALDPSTRRKLLLVLGELLHVFRPLFWAHAEKQHARYRQVPSHALWLSWMSALGMDLASFRCLTKVVSSNEITRDEMRRRQMRIFLCLLREPAWEYLSQPIAQRLVSLVDRMPVFGRLLATYLWDLLTHWKHPFFLEEG